MNNTNDINSTLKYINKIYDGLSYYDLYGGSVINFFLLTMFVFLVWSYCVIMQTKEVIASDWVNQRCKPSNIPFAGLINKPENKTAFEYTGENFQFCLNSILVDITGALVQPITFLINSLQKSFKALGASINAIRNVVNEIRKRIAVFTQEVLGRILNILVPFQKIILAVSDTFAKMQASLTTGLYTVLSSYLTLKALMGSIIEIIISVMLACAIIIAGLFAGFFTAPLAVPLMAVYVVIAVVVTIIIVAMKDILNIQKSSVPKVRCFDKHTKLAMASGKEKEIQYIDAGDMLKNGIRVTATIRVDAKDLRMFNLNNIIVSESHIVNYENKWLPVREHPNAIEIFNYTEPELYCLNTGTKEIIIKGIKFTDWDEIYGTSLKIITRSISKDGKRIDIENIDDILFEGFDREIEIDLENNRKKKICAIEIGDNLINGGIIYGIVELYKHNLGDNREKMYHLLVSNGKFEIEGNIYMDYNNRIDSILK